MPEFRFSGTLDGVPIDFGPRGEYALAVFSLVPVVVGGEEVSLGEALRGLQPASTTLAALALVQTKGDSFLYTDADGAFATAPIGDMGRRLLGDAEPDDARGTLGLGTAAVADLGGDPGDVPVLGDDSRLPLAALPLLGINSVSGLQAALDGKQDAAPGTVSGGGEYALQRFSSGLMMAMGTTVLVLDDGGGAYINPGARAIEGAWFPLVGNGDHGVSGSYVTASNSSAEGFSIRFSNSGSTVVRLNWLAFARWK